MANRLLISYLSLGQLLEYLVASRQFLRRIHIELKGRLEFLRRHYFHGSILRSALPHQLFGVLDGISELLDGWVVSFHLLDLV